MSTRKKVSTPYFGARQPIAALSLGIAAPVTLAYATSIPGIGSSLAALVVRISIASTGGTPPHLYTFSAQAAVSNRSYSEPMTIDGSVLHRTGQADGAGAQVVNDDVLDTMEINLATLSGAPAVAATALIGVLWEL